MIASAMAMKLSVMAKVKLILRVVIIRLERKGVVRKLGVEEHQHKP